MPGKKIRRRTKTGTPELHSSHDLWGGRLCDEPEFVLSFSVPPSGEIEYVDTYSNPDAT